MSRSVADLLDLALARLPDGTLVVGYSGGVDSHLLLHTLAQLPEARARGLRAVHVDHGLQPDSAGWAEHCARICSALALPLATHRIEVVKGDEGLEAAARRARWSAFAQALGPTDILVLAQHLDDQAETVLLRLLRGAGPTGLAAMRPWSPRADGLRVWRPWLGLGPGTANLESPPITAPPPPAVAEAQDRQDRQDSVLHPGPALPGVDRATILAAAQRAGLAWVEDPANADASHDRTVLRQQVLPALRTRWPRAASQLAQAADRQADAQALERQVATALLARAATPVAGIVRWSVLAQASRPLRWAALRDWLAGHGVDPVGADLLARIDAEVIGAAAETGPRLDLGTCILRRYRERLYLLPPGADAPASYRIDWTGCAALRLPAGVGELCIEPVPSAPMALIVASRAGGERLRLHPGGPRRDLRVLLQEAGLPPWQRARWPVLWLAGEPVAFADLLLAPALAGPLQAAGAQLRFRPD